jgi:hypothetical protein
MVKMSQKTEDAHLQNSTVVVFVLSGFLPCISGSAVTDCTSTYVVSSKVLKYDTYGSLVLVSSWAEAQY